MKQYNYMFKIPNNFFSRLVFKFIKKHYFNSATYKISRIRGSHLRKNTKRSSSWDIKRDEAKYLRIYVQDKREENAVAVTMHNLVRAGTLSDMEQIEFPLS